MGFRGRVRAGVLGLRQLLKSTRRRGHKIIEFDLSCIDDYGGLIDQMKGVDGIIHSAGTVLDIPARNISIDQLEATFRINTFSPIMLTLGMLNAGKILPQGSVIFISSIATRRPQKAQMVYAMSKASLAVATTCLTNEFTRAKKIRFNNLILGLVNTPVLDHAKRFYGSKAIDSVNKSYPLEIGEPEDIASAILFLLSEKSRWISGSSIVVDGGRLSSL